MSNRNQHGKTGLNFGVRGVCLAAMLALIATPVSAQDLSEFEDPLAQIRAQVQEIDSGAAAVVEDAVNLGSVDGQNPASASATTPDVKDPLARISERLGLPVLGLVALAGLALLALLLGVMWLITRLRSRRRTSKKLDSDLYAVNQGARGRRDLESGTMAARKNTLKPETESKDTDVLKLGVPSAAAAAAAIISNDAAPAEEEYDLTETEERAAYSAKADARIANEAPVDTDATDPSSWRRPNLDRLKASIRDDWQGDKEDKAAKATAAAAAVAATGVAATTTAVSEATNDVTDTVAENTVSPLHREAENFASLFGDDDAAPTRLEDTESFFGGGMSAPSREDRTMFSDLRSTIEKTADISPPEALEKRRAELPSREDAMRRIKALREAVKAS